MCKLLCTVLNVGKVARFYNGPSYHESTVVPDKKVLGVVPSLSKGIVTVPVSVIGNALEGTVPGDFHLFCSSINPIWTML